MKKREIVNLTPHPLNIFVEGRKLDPVVTVPPSGLVARVLTSQRRVDYGKVFSMGNEVAIFETVYGEVTDLPEPQEGVVFVTSLLVAQKVRRSDVLSPGELVRNKEGNPIGCRGLCRHTTEESTEPEEITQETDPGCGPYVGDIHIVKGIKYRVTHRSVFDNYPEFGQDTAVLSLERE